MYLILRVSILSSLALTTSLQSLDIPHKSPTRLKDCTQGQKFEEVTSLEINGLVGQVNLQRNEGSHSKKPVLAISYRGIPPEVAKKVKISNKKGHLRLSFTEHYLINEGRIYLGKKFKQKAVFEQTDLDENTRLKALTTSDTHPTRADRRRSIHLKYAGYDLSGAVITLAYPRTISAYKLTPGLATINIVDDIEGSLLLQIPPSGQINAERVKSDNFKADVSRGGNLKIHTLITPGFKINVGQGDEATTSILMTPNFSLAKLKVSKSKPKATKSKKRQLSSSNDDKGGNNKPLIIPAFPQEPTYGESKEKLEMPPFINYLSGGSVSMPGIVIENYVHCFKPAHSQTIEGGQDTALTHKAGNLSA
ncbi:hypothetical protein [Candidatus Odyssella thessalonicensis]|uniref:hypothetical protein n=1 Tax=Candidatus Odyssella thessalonicensis TaxID=84647 RepID=UPI000225AF13|nr:hypothetical protein [Candidatus Odyssella thessalonicensis]